jgi:hypothetical protein
LEPDYLRPRGGRRPKEHDAVIRRADSIVEIQWHQSSHPGLLVLDPVPHRPRQHWCNPPLLSARSVSAYIRPLLPPIPIAV